MSTPQYPSRPEDYEHGTATRERTRHIGSLEIHFLWKSNPRPEMYYSESFATKLNALWPISTTHELKWALSTWIFFYKSVLLKNVFFIYIWTHDVHQRHHVAWCRSSRLSTRPHASLLTCEWSISGNNF
jgi:hypothetical protein